MKRVSKTETAPPQSPAIGESQEPRLDGTIVKVFSVMELLVHAEHPLGVSSIAQSLGLQKSNVHRLLTTLRALGYVQQHPDTSRYSLTLKTWEFGMKVASRNVVKRIALPFLRQLHQQSGESAHLSVLVGTDMLYLEALTGPYPLRATTPAGARVPAVFPASGRVLLAYRDDAAELLDELARNHLLAAKLDMTQVMSELALIRQRGYAISLSGWRNNVNSVSAAILNASGQPVAAVGVSGPSERLNQDRLEELAPAVLNVAAEIGEALGSASSSEA